MQERLGDLVFDAYMLAARVHAGQWRASGEPFIDHPLAVAETLFALAADVDLVCAAILHDGLEENADNAKIEDEIRERFGDYVLYLVLAVSKDTSDQDKHRRHANYLHQLTCAIELDLSVFFLKAADLLHNIRTIAFLSSERQELWLKELQYDYLSLFGTYFHQVPLPYRPMYHRLVDSLQTEVLSREHE